MSPWAAGETTSNLPKQPCLTGLVGCGNGGPGGCSGGDHGDRGPVGCRWAEPCGHSIVAVCTGSHRFAGGGRALQAGPMALHNPCPLGGPRWAGGSDGTTGVLFFRGPHRCCSGHIGDHLHTPPGCRSAGGPSPDTTPNGTGSVGWPRLRWGCFCSHPEPWRWRWAA